MGIFPSKYSQFERELPDVSGKVFAITGTTSGTGFVAAETVARHGGEILLLNRPSSRSKDSLAKLKELVPDGKFVAIDCDLQEFASVRRAAAEIKSRYQELYCLSNNAGIMAVPDEITADGFDKQMQTNHLSHFLLTKELMPLLRASAKRTGDARIVQHSSIARDENPGDKMLQENYFTLKEKDGMLGGDMKDAVYMQGPQWIRYSQTKLANSVFCQTLHEKLSAAGEANTILSLCAHPGVARTNLADNLDYGLVMQVIWGLMQALVLQSAEDGAMGLLKAMMDTKKNVRSGILYGPQSWAGCPVEMLPREYESDPKSKAMLWRTSEAATGVTFDI